MTTQNSEIYVGLTLEQFKALYPNLVFRIECIDGDYQKLNADFNPNRINLTIDGNLITSVAWF